MQKKHEESFKVGKYKFSRTKTRVQGETRVFKTKFFTGVVRSVVGFAIVVIMVGVAFVVGMGLNTHTTFHRKFFVRAENVDTNRPYKSMAVIESSTGRLLAGYHEHEKLPMASTTKIMTAIIAIEKTEDLDVLIEVPDVAVGVEGSSMYLRRGEVLSMRDYLYGLMLPSGNDSAVAIANIIAGSEENFALIMNEYASKLGLNNTHFVTSSGLHDAEHYTTSYDLARLSAYAMGNETFREIVSTPSYVIEAKEKARVFKNKQKLMHDKDLISCGILVTGIKSGFTPEAGRCLVTSAEFNGMEVIAVVLNAPQMFESTASILKETQQDYKMVEILFSQQHISKIGVVGGDKNEINIYSHAGFSYPLTAEEEVVLKIKYNYPPEISAPVQKEQEIGNVVVELYGEEIFNTPIRAIESVNENGVEQIINKMIENF